MAVINKLDEQIIHEAVNEKYDELKIKKEDEKIYLDINKFNKNTTAFKYRLIRKILTELLGNTQNIEMIHIKDTCKLIETNITNKQYILGKKYKVIIEKKNLAVFVKNM